MFIRHPLTLLTKEVPPLELNTANTCLLLQDLHAPFTDPEAGRLASYARSKVLLREFDEYFDALDLVRPNISRILATARELELYVAHSCLGYRPPAGPSTLQQATGWDWDLDGPEGRFPSDWKPLDSERIFAKAGWGALTNPDLEQFLADRGIEYVVLIGAMFEFGIRQTCGELMDRGLGCLIISDAVIPLTQAGHAYTRGHIAHGLTKLRTAGEFLGLLDVLRVEGNVLV